MEQKHTNYPLHESRRAYPFMAAHYAFFVPFLTPIARDLGYALAVHGSMATDLDLVAVPWTPDAASAKTLVEAVRERVGGFIRNDPDASQWEEYRRNPVDRPHGRRAWAIYLHPDYQGPYIDLSVMPRQEVSK